MHYLKGFFIRLSLRSCNVVDLCYPLHTALGCSTSVLVFWLLAHETRDLSQAEKIHKMITISLTMVEVVIISENSCHFVSCCKQQLFSSQLEISHVLNGTNPENQHRNRGPRLHPNHIDVPSS